MSKIEIMKDEANKLAWERPVVNRLDAADAEMGLDPTNTDLNNMQMVS